MTNIMSALADTFARIAAVLVSGHAEPQRVLVRVRTDARSPRRPRA